MLFLSSLYDETTLKKESKHSFLIQKEYIFLEKGVDRMNQMISYYDGDRKSYKWWKKVFFFAINICINNAYILWNYFHTKETIFDFRNNLVDEILAFTQTKYNKINNPFVYNSIKLISVTTLHELSLGNKPRDCKLCSNRKNGIRKITKYICKECLLNLCPICFTNYHKKFVYI